MSVRRFYLFLCILLVTSAFAKAQVQTGSYPFGSFDTNGPDGINAGNLNVSWIIPVLNKSGRSKAFTYNLAYNSLIWSPVASGSTMSWQPTLSNGSYWGWQGLSGAGQSQIVYSYTYSSGTCYYNGQSASYQSNSFSAQSYLDNSGTSHALSGGLVAFQSPGGNGCPPTSPQPSGTVKLTTNDGSGIVGTMTYESGSTIAITLTDKNGNNISAPLVSFNSLPQGSLFQQDANGNQITVNNGQYTDNTGTIALSVIGTAPQNTSLTYPLPSGSSNANASYTVSYKSYPIHTHFGCAIGDYGPISQSLVDYVTRPDGTSYHFTYEATPNDSSSVTGRVASVTMPTGGIVSYSYQGGTCGNGMNTDGSTAGLTRITSDGTRTYSSGTFNNSYETTLQDEKGNQTLRTFSVTSDKYYYETFRRVFQGAASSGTYIKDVYTCYNGSSAPCFNESVASPLSELMVYVSYNGGSQTTMDSLLTDQGALVTKSNFYGGGGLQVTTNNSYNILSNNVTELTSSTVVDGSNNAVASATYGYDESAPQGTSSLPQHVSVSTPRGNQTSAAVSTGGATLNTTTSYYDTGVPLSATTPGGFNTSYSYDSTGTFAVQSTLPATASGVTLATSAAYDITSGALLNASGPNTGQTTTVNLYDSMLRATQITLPSGGVQNLSYSGANLQSSSMVLGSGPTAVQAALLDAYGRVSRQAVYDGLADTSQNWYQVDTCYDPTGLVSFVSTQYQGSGFAGVSATPRCSGAGTSYTYDALGRVLTITTGDGTYTNTYSSRAVLSKDVNGVQRITQYDLLGRISGICELSTATLGGDSPSPSTCGMDIAGTGFITSYSYDLANHKTTVTQGSQVRTFQTDAAGRTILVQEPERGTTTYSYIYNSLGLQMVRTRPKANQQGNAVTNTTTQYDALGRTISLNYDDGLTPAKHYFYDTAANLGWSQTPANPLGNLVSTATTTNSGSALTSSQMSYDLSGNVTAIWQCAPSICGTSNQQGRGADTVGFDYAGNLISSSDSASGSISYARSSAGELTAMTQNTYTDAANVPNLVSGVVNSAFGPVNWTLGNGLKVVKSYDSLGRNNGNWACQGTGTSSSFYCPNGDTQLVSSATDYSGVRAILSCGTNLGGCVTPGYDDFNRLVSVSGQTPSYAYTYDRYGNRLTQTASPSGLQSSYTFVNNRVSSAYGVTYDAAGNLSNDGMANNFTYDAEGNVIAVSGPSPATYAYDALNRRVSSQTSSGTTEYVYNPEGQRTSSWLVTGNGAGFGNEGRLYWDGQQIGYRASDGATFFQHKNEVGTDLARSNYQGQIATQEVSSPFGDSYTTSSPDVSGSSQDNFEFAGLEHDAESGSEHAIFRQYSSTQGRWMSPDPYDGSYDSTNPQSLNRYAYVQNATLTFQDPTGLEASFVCSFCSSVGDFFAGVVDYLAEIFEGGGGGGGGDLFPFGFGSGSGQPGGIIYGGAAGAGGGGIAPSNAPGQPQDTCQEQRILNAIPGSQLTGGETAQGGHEQFNIQVNSADLTAAGFTPYTTIFGTPNGYHNGSLFLQVHVNGQNGTQLPGGGGVLNVQGHIDVFNPAAGYGVGLLLHTIYDLGIGSLFFRHSARLDPGC